MTIASSRPGQSRIRFNAANIIHTVDLQRAHSRPIRTGKKLEKIIDLDIEGLLRTQDMGIESSIQNE